MAKKGKGNRAKITLACLECRERDGVERRNYDSMKNRKNDPERLEMEKYCNVCKKHTKHKETK
jgi:large subunit ribosomal protein L33